MKINVNFNENIYSTPKKNQKQSNQTTLTWTIEIELNLLNSKTTGEEKELIPGLVDETHQEIRNEVKELIFRVVDETHPQIRNKYKEDVSEEIKEPHSETRGEENNTHDEIT
ncbi:hypothetical protein O181_102508 [Austropuccinia psidii MF-1]|uniref:Uncharacterized protein n=1 Tax=Austropuccinia psidii MF-1 TaxID=1389203 RepID=A0A9Q3JGH0_9BASI|nr:hypothetical protein [Austropuccinia psidii MF-1]